MIGATAPSRRVSGSAATVLAFAVLVVLVFVDGQLSLRYIDYTPKPTGYVVPPLLEGYARWDTGWYLTIAEAGYFYDGPGRQSAVAFFPAYPLAMRLLGAAVGSPLVAGVAVTLASGLAVTVLFRRWVAGFLGDRTATFALALVVTYPFAYYLFGAVYSDALFLAATLAAFTLLERDRPLLAGLAGALATGARPVGIAVVLGLALRTLELRGVLPRPRRSNDAKVDGTDRRARLRPRDLGVLVSVAGLAAYAMFLWVGFGDPLAFTRVGSAPGWYRTVDLETVAKVHLFRLLGAYGLDIVTFWLVAQGLFALVALALVPATIRRFGWGYGTYVAVAVGMAFVSTRDFIGMGRYVLVAFPAFATAADLVLRWGAEPDRPGRLARWRWTVPPLVLTVSACGLGWTVSLFSRWYFLS